MGDIGCYLTWVEVINAKLLLILPLPLPLPLPQPLPLPLPLPLAQAVLCRLQPPGLDLLRMVGEAATEVRPRP